MTKKAMVLMVLGLFILTLTSAVATSIIAYSPGGTPDSDSATTSSAVWVSYTLSVGSSGYANIVWNYVPYDSQTTQGQHSSGMSVGSGAYIEVNALGTGGTAYASASW